MKITINNQQFGVLLIIILLSIPFISAFKPRHKILYNLSQYENYVSPSNPEVLASKQAEYRIKRAEFLESLGISRGELWMSRVRFVIILIGSIVGVIGLLGYIDALLTDKIKFKAEVNIGPKLNAEHERLERLGRKLLSLPIEEQEYLRNRLKEDQNAIVQYDESSKEWI